VVKVGTGRQVDVCLRLALALRSDRNPFPSWNFSAAAGVGCTGRGMHTIWRVTKVIVLSLLGLVLALLGSAFAYRAYRQHEVSKTTAIDPANGIDEVLFAKIGGIDQWISIRGQRRDNPVLLILHGGPGFALSLVPRDRFFDWTQYFTLVQWDQRGAGKTFGRSGPLDPAITIERMALDGVEVTEFLRARLRRPKIVLVGISWGSNIGVRMAKARPDLFYAHVGTGQAVNQRKYRPLAYAQLLAEAQTKNDRRAIQELEANGPPPYDSIAKATVHTKWANAYEPGQPSMWHLMSIVIFESGAGLQDLSNYWRGVADSQDHFREAAEATDLPAIGMDFAVPFFVFQGALDHMTPVQPVQEYVDNITAKALVLIPNAGHNVIATKRHEFLRLLIQHVRPLALSLVARGEALNYGSTIDPTYYTVVDGDGQTTTSREAGVHVGGNPKPAAEYRSPVLHAPESDPRHARFRRVRCASFSDWCCRTCRRIIRRSRARVA
jgi:pimeloyl-ACP methyl ester carboxylesterase